MLSSLTPYLEYHSAMLGAGVFPALIKAVLDARMIPQVSLTKQHTGSGTLLVTYAWYPSMLIKASIVHKVLLR